eukprot:365285-Chlamydomonas_euryale.AAC.9
MTFVPPFLVYDRQPGSGVEPGPGLVGWGVGVGAAPCCCACPWTAVSVSAVAVVGGCKCVESVESRKPSGGKGQRWRVKQQGVGGQQAVKLQCVEQPWVVYLQCVGGQRAIKLECAEGCAKQQFLEGQRDSG